MTGHMTAGLRGAPQAVRGRGWGRRRIAGWWRCNLGVSAVEFALVAPILGFMLLAGVDMARAISERMAMDHALRAGAQASIADPGEVTVLEVMRATADTNFTLDGDVLDGGPAPINLSATRFCACPESVGVAVTCSTICTGSKPTFIYYRLLGDKTYTGWIMPVFGFDRSMQIQIR